MSASTAGTFNKPSTHGAFKSIPQKWSGIPAIHHPNMRHDGDPDPYGKTPGELHTFGPKKPTPDSLQEKKQWQLIDNRDEKMLWRCPDNQYHITRAAALKTLEQRSRVHDSFPKDWEVFQPVNVLWTGRNSTRNSMNYALKGDPPAPNTGGKWNFRAIVQPGDPDYLTLDLCFVAREVHKLLWWNGHNYLVTHSRDARTPFHEWKD